MKKDEKASSSVDTESLSSRAKLEQLLRARAHKDEAFRQALLTNPKVVLERDYADYLPAGKVPDGKIIEVTEEDERIIHLVLLPRSSDILSDISAELLEGVQGGSLLSKIGLSSLTKDLKGPGRSGAARADTGEPGCSEPCHSGRPGCGDLKLL